MNLFNFLTSLGKQWSLPVPNWSVDSFLEKLELLSSGKICSWRTWLFFRGKFPVGNFSVRKVSARNFPPEKVFARKIFHRKLSNFSSGKVSNRKSFRNFRLPAEIFVSEIYRDSGFRFIFSGNYNYISPLWHCHTVSVPCTCVLLMSGCLVKLALVLIGFEPSLKLCTCNDWFWP